MSDELILPTEFETSDVDMSGDFVYNFGKRLPVRRLPDNYVARSAIPPFNNDESESIRLNCNASTHPSSHSSSATAVDMGLPISK